VISPTYNNPYLSTQSTQETDIRAPGGIRILNPSMLVAAHPRLRPRGHSFRLTVYKL